MKSEKKLISHLEDDIKEQRKGIIKDRKSISTLKKIIKHERKS